MKVHVHPADEGGCGYYRLRWPAEALRTAGYAVEVREHHEGVWLDLRQEQVLLDIALPEADVVVLQRPLRETSLLTLRALRKKGVAVVVEIDDDFSSVQPDHPSWWSVHPHSPTGQSSIVLAQACREADMVTVTTPALAQRYGGHGRVRVIPNFVPAFYLTLARPAQTEEHPVLGWAGPSVVHPGDLEVTDGVVLSVMDATGARFRTIGDPQTLARLGVPDDRGEVVGRQDLASGAYARAVAGFDVGMVPLRRSAFNAAKSSLKGLEYAALGVPFVASPTPAYIELWRAGMGMIAHRPRHWRTLLTALLQSPDVREEQRAAGRAMALRHTIENNADQWWQAWALARDNANARHPFAVTSA